jgi:hypothetical protein
VPTSTVLQLIGAPIRRRSVHVSATGTRGSLRRSADIDAMSESSRDPEPCATSARGPFS